MACNKIAFEKKKQAEAYVATVRARNHCNTQKYANRKLKIYFCVRCGQWHLTSKRKIKGKALKTWANMEKARKANGK